MSDEITRQGLEELKAELEHLEGPARRDIAQRIRTAREWGDLKENSEYHDAKNDQAFLETKIQRLSERLRSAVVVDDEGAGAGGEVRFGSQVRARDEQSGQEVDYRLVGAGEADLSAGRLSVETPVAQALLGLREGDVATVTTPRGEKRLRVLSVD